MLIQVYAFTKVALGEAGAWFHARAVEVTKSERGATAAEYALLVALIAVAIIAGAKALGSSVNSKLNSTATSVGGA